MQVKVLKNSNKIGGSITEITSQKGAKIIIDYGEELTDDVLAEKKFPIPGLTIPPRKYDALFITHIHSDHIGLINDCLEDIPIYIEKTALKIYEVTQAFAGEKIPTNIKTFTFGEKIKVADFFVTPYRTDHSAYNSAMFLVEDAKTKVLHMGDYRANGRYGKNFLTNLKKIKRIDLLITEGTGITRGKNKNRQETSLEAKAEKIFKESKQIFILQASTNLDRLKTFCEAALKTGKNVLLDICSANILKVLDTDEFPYLNNPQVGVFIPYKYLDKKQKHYTLKEPDFYAKYILPFKANISRYSKLCHDDYVMFIKTSMAIDLAKSLSNYRNQACFIYSMWDGYRSRVRKGTEKMQEFIKLLKDLNIQEIPEVMHTSGHADYPTLKKVAKILKASKIIGIHTEDNAALKEVFGPNYEIIKDNDIIEI